MKKVKNEYLEKKSKSFLKGYEEGLKRGGEIKELIISKFREKEKVLFEGYTFKDFGPKSQHWVIHNYKPNKSCIKFSTRVKVVKI